MKKELISISDARYLVLHNQLLLNSEPGSTKKDLLNIIKQLGYIQIDTISIVERAHKHILWTRLPSFKNEMLDELIDKDKKVFEFWDHAAAYLPIEHFRFTLLRKEMYAGKYKGWGAKNKKLLDYIYDRIKNEGPLQSRDFEEPGKRGAWWKWKPAKDGLEFLFHTGKLVLRARKNFQKVYDLPERFLPSKNLDTSAPDDEEYSEHLIMKSIKANGLASEKEITYLRHHNRTTTKKTLARLLEEKKIIPVVIHNIDKEIYYSTTKILKQLNSQKEIESAHILSPFDNLIIQRKRLKTFFDIDFVVEFYLPEAKRKFGYFCMPVLYKDKFVCKIDAKADRKTETFKVINIFIEGNTKKLSKHIENIIADKLQKLAEFSGCKYGNFILK